MLDCLYAKATPYITDCVMAELEKLGQKYRVALRIAKVRVPALSSLRLICYGRQGYRWGIDEASDLRARARNLRRGMSRR
jgi:rRNA-processing protein FCF1